MNERALRVVVAAPVEEARSALRRLVEAQWGWQVLGEAADGLAAVRDARAAHADVLLVDGAISRPSLAGLRDLIPSDAPVVMVALVDHPRDLAYGGVAVLKGVPGDRMRRIILDALDAHWTRPGATPEVHT